MKLPAGSVCLEELACVGWPAAVGKKVAARTRAVSLDNCRLSVEVEDVVWKRQLSVLKGQILRRLEEVLGPKVVVDIDFRISPRRRVPGRAEAPRRASHEADQIQDPVLRVIYKQQRPRKMA